jgi:TetR/AcrR family transcriptional repressor of lmrAB and yxaGH operons
VPRRDRSRAALVETAGALLRRQGYAATGLAQVLAESGATTGSLYHHFPDGKEALAEAAIDAAAEQVARTLQAVLDRPGDLATAVGRWGKGLAAALAADPRDGCPVAPVALESIHGSVRLRAAAARAFASWRTVLAQRLVRDGWSTVDAERDATTVLALIEGSLLLARTAGDGAPLHDLTAATERLLRRA